MFLFYSLAGSIPMICVLAYFYNKLGSLDYFVFMEHLPSLNRLEKIITWAAFMIMFAVKVPMFPVHSWLLAAHVEATAGASIILAAVLLKVGIFGIIRYPLTLFNDISKELAPLVIVLALVSILYSAIASITELDAKRVIALTSIAHMNLCVMGIFIFDPRGLYGAIILSIGHAFVSGGLFLLIGLLYDRCKTRELTMFGCLASSMPLFSSALFYFCFANAGFPWAFSFVGEIMVIMGIIKQLSLVAFFVLLISLVLLLYANIRLFIHICFGAPSNVLSSNTLSDFALPELALVVWLMANSFFLMWGNSFYFWPLYLDYALKMIY